jgi:hypothetical protein
VLWLIWSPLPRLRTLDGPGAAPGGEIEGAKF